MYSQQDLDPHAKERQNGNSMNYLTSILGGRLPIVVFGARYREGYYALMGPIEMIDDLRPTLLGDDHGRSVSRDLVDKPWFPGTYDDSAINAVRALATKLHGMSPEQFHDVYETRDFDSQPDWPKGFIKPSTLLGDEARARQIESFLELTQFYYG